MRIMVVGGAGFGNYGDEALLRATVQACKRAAPDARILVASNNPKLLAETLRGYDYEVVPSPRYFFFGAGDDYTQASDRFREHWRILRQEFVGRNLVQIVWKMLFVPATRFVWRRDAVRFLRALYGCDALVIHGGGILTSATRSRLWEHALTAQLAAAAGLRVLLRSHQFGPYDNPEDEARLREIVQCASFLSCRDRAASADAVRAIEPTAEVIEHVDDALHVAYPTGDAATVLARFGLKPGGYVCAGFRHNAAVDFDGRHAAKMAAILRQAHERTGLPVVLLPQGSFDVPAMQDLRQRLGPIAILPELQEPMTEILTVAANAAMMIATPHHSLLFALRGRVPIISPVSGAYYRAKNTGSMANFDLQDFVIDLDRDDHAALAGAAIDRIVQGDVAPVLTRALERIGREAAEVEARFAAALCGRA